MSGIPTPVVVADGQSPIPVIINQDPTQPPSTTVIKGEGTTLSPTTTEQQDEVTAGQRKVNLIWEYTQSAISILIVLALIYCAIAGVTSDGISNAAFLVIGFYFSRTNHQSIGGVGPKPLDVYVGR
jgi:hypothetical protein